MYWAWWHVPTIPTLGRLKLKDHGGFKANLGYAGRPHLKTNEQRGCKYTLPLLLNLIIRLGKSNNYYNSTAMTNTVVIQKEFIYMYGPFTGDKVTGVTQ